ncbi:MAG: ABC transporter permease [Bacteroidetes bacterium]|nr:ABC transporter permease [Bacteroidota bacterium]
MNLRLIFSISKSLLLARLKQTVVAAVGVTFSITMFVTLLSFMTGLNIMLDGLILNRTPHVRLFNDIKPSKVQPIDASPEFKGDYNFISSIKSGAGRKEIYNSGAIMQQINSDERVLGLAPRINAPVFFNDGAIEITASINGVDVQEETRLFHFNEYVTTGNPIDLKNVSNSIILGKALAQKLLANVGDVVQLTTSQGERFPLKVVGYFESGLLDFDKTQAYASIGTVQNILGKDKSYVTDLQVKLKDILLASEVAKEYAELFQTDAEDIQTANSQFETGSRVRSIISYSVGITLLIVAGFGIYNILNMMIFEKMETIAILKATGFSGKDVKRIFLTIAMTIGFVGGMAGLLFGFLLSSLIDQIPFNTAALPTVTTFPINYNIVYYFIGGIFSLITTYFAGFFPARKAGKVDPVVIIRGK